MICSHHTLSWQGPWTDSEAKPEKLRLSQFGRAPSPR